MNFLHSATEQNAYAARCEQTGAEAIFLRSADTAGRIIPDEDHTGIAQYPASIIATVRNASPGGALSVTRLGATKREVAARLRWGGYPKTQREFQDFATGLSG